jgi:DNA mismatch endonuclease (patch repair protein)
MMAAIRGVDTKPELRLRSALHRQGFRYRLHDRLLPGRPDLVLPRYRAAIFVHGCFWHRHEGCHWCTTPASNSDFWSAKFAANVERDLRHRQELRQAGWRVATVWECALRREPSAVLDEIVHWLRLPGEPTWESPVIRRRARLDPSGDAEEDGPV